MRSLVVSLLLAFSVPGHALQFIKCGSHPNDGKTFWASFGKQVRSGETQPIYFPIDFTVLNGPKSLQDRIYYRTKDALQIPLTVTTSSIQFSFTAKGADGVTDQTEVFDLRLMSPKDLTGFQGSWITYDVNNIMIQKINVMCSAL